MTVVESETEILGTIIVGCILCGRELLRIIVISSRVI